MHSQHADAVPLRGRVADNFNIAPIKPVDKHLERGMRVAFECQRGVEQFINGIARLRAQTPEQLSPSIERAGENMLQITIRRGEIGRSEEHTSELQSLMRISYAVFCLKKQHNIQDQKHSVNDSEHTCIDQITTRMSTDEKTEANILDQHL